ncbi:testis development-related protein-like isoform X3 [Stegostoma tigrinum]|uniref:testis development-related protein-like isoform X3 n=1 Tax=Stegostoma tigrinum TaxID=3053191 RepID=UPI00202B4EA9|nr:testis development-related protein-like isoform X3 [Stegostoma tigrinum]
MSDAKGCMLSSKDPLLPEETTSSVSQLATKNHKMIQDRSGHSVHHTWSSSLKQKAGGRRGKVAGEKPGNVQGASLKGWKEVTSLFNKDDEHKLLTDSEPKWCLQNRTFASSCAVGCKWLPPHILRKQKFPPGTTVKLKEEVKMEKKSSFWDSLGIKQNSASKIPTEDEVWDPQVKVENPCSGLTDSSTWSDWASETCGSSKYTSLDSETNTGGSKWSIMTAGKLPGIRRRSKGNLTDCWEEIE